MLADASRTQLGGKFACRRAKIVHKAKPVIQHKLPCTCTAYWAFRLADVRYTMSPNLAALTCYCEQGTSNISGLMSGNLVITHKGMLTVRAHGTGHEVILHFKEPSMFASMTSKKADKHEVMHAAAYVWHSRILAWHLHFCTSMIRHL